MVSLAPSHSLLPQCSFPRPAPCRAAHPRPAPSLDHPTHSLPLRRLLPAFPAALAEASAPKAACGDGSGAWDCGCILLPRHGRLLGPFVVPLWTLPRHSFKWPPSAHTDLPTSPGWSEYFAASFSWTFIQHPSCPNQRSGCLSLAHSTVGNRLSQDT